MKRENSTLIRLRSVIQRLVNWWVCYAAFLTANIYVIAVLPGMQHLRLCLVQTSVRFPVGTKAARHGTASSLPLLPHMRSVGLSVWGSTSVSTSKCSGKLSCWPQTHSHNWSCTFKYSDTYLVFSIFGHGGEEAEEVVYVNWLNMVRAGLLGLEFYTPENKSWRQVCYKIANSFKVYSWFILID